VASALKKAEQDIQPMIKIADAALADIDHVVDKILQAYDAVM
jgi:flagellar hook-basal body complex protein FliE